MTNHADRSTSTFELACAGAEERLTILANSDVSRGMHPRGIATGRGN